MASNFILPWAEWGLPTGLTAVKLSLCYKCAPIGVRTGWRPVYSHAVWDPCWQGLSYFRAGTTGYSLELSYTVGKVKQHRLRHAKTFVSACLLILRCHFLSALPLVTSNS